MVQKLCNMHPGIVRADIEKIVDTIILEIINALSRSEAVEIRGWGRVKTTLRRAKTGRNPKNGQVIKIPEKKIIKWKMSKILYNRVNKKFTENKIADIY